MPNIFQKSVTIFLATYSRACRDKALAKKIVTDKIRNNFPQFFTVINYGDKNTFFD